MFGERKKSITETLKSKGISFERRLMKSDELIRTKLQIP